VVINTFKVPRSGNAIFITWADSIIAPEIRVSA
jgi:hypothetical protein